MIAFTRAPLCCLNGPHLHCMRLRHITAQPPELITATLVNACVYTLVQWFSKCGRSTTSGTQAPFL